MMQQSFKEDETGCYRRIFKRDWKIVEASWVVALEIAKHKKPHTIAETLINSCVLKMAYAMLGKDVEKKLVLVLISNNLIQKTIRDLSYDIKYHVVEQITTIPFGLFAIQSDGSTNISSCALLMVFVKYVYNDTFKEEFLFSSPLETTIKAADILEKVSTFF